MSDPRYKVVEASSLKMEDGAKELLNSPEMQPYHDSRPVGKTSQAATSSRTRCVVLLARISHAE